MRAFSRTAGCMNSKLKTIWTAAIHCSSESARRLRASHKVTRLRKASTAALPRLAKELRIAETDVAFLVEVAHAAGLLDVGGAHRDEWLPTRSYDAWREQDLADRWATSRPGAG